MTPKTDKIYNLDCLKGKEKGKEEWQLKTT